MINEKEFGAIKKVFGMNKQEFMRMIVNELSNSADFPGLVNCAERWFDSHAPDVSLEDVNAQIELRVEKARAEGCRNGAEAVTRSTIDTLRSEWDIGREEGVKEGRRQAATEMAAKLRGKVDWEGHRLTKKNGKFPYLIKGCRVGAAFSSLLDSIARERDSVIRAPSKRNYEPLTGGGFGTPKSESTSNK